MALWLKPCFLSAETLPQGQNGDAYLLRLILHDWSDADCVAILKSIRKAMGATRCRLLIVEASIDCWCHFQLLQQCTIMHCLFRAMSKLGPSTLFCTVMHMCPRTFIRQQ